LFERVTKSMGTHVGEELLEPDACSSRGYGYRVVDMHY
jgi:hypothetical protein